jgi:hypothetical protein
LRAGLATAAKRSNSGFGKLLLGFYSFVSELASYHRGTSGGAFCAPISRGAIMKIRFLFLEGSNRWPTLSGRPYRGGNPRAVYINGGVLKKVRIFHYLYVKQTKMKLNRVAGLCAPLSIRKKNPRRIPKFVLLFDWHIF